MADLTWTDVLIIGGVATVGFTFLSYWWSGIMSRRGWSWQVKSKPRKPKKENRKKDKPRKGKPRRTKKGGRRKAQNEKPRKDTPQEPKKEA